MKEPLKDCPFCHEFPILAKERLWTDNGHGYYNCYDIFVKCDNPKCHVRPHTRSYTTIYEDEEKCKEQAYADWNNR